MKMNRRDFLKKAAVCGCGVYAWGSMPMFSAKPAYALPGNGTKLLLVNMNGGWDGLSILQPRGGTVYDTLTSFRPTLRTDPSALLPAGSHFGFHPALTQFKQLFDQGELGTIMNVGYEHMSRSHLDAEVAFARGVPSRLTPQASGFINRLGHEYQFSSLQAVSVTGSDPAFAGGQYTGIQVSGLSQFNFLGDNTQSSQENRHRRDSIYAVSQQWELDETKPKQKEVTDAIEIASNTADSVRSALTAATFVQNYPETYLGRSFRDADVLFSSPSLGTDIAYIRRTGLDTHSNQTETLVPILQELNVALGTFIANMIGKGLWERIIVLLFSEFGRTTKENDSRGTDHGGALPVFLTGGRVKGQLVGSLNSADLTNHGWLPAKSNIVEVYRSVVQQMGYDPNRVFQHVSNPTLPGLFRS